MSLLGAQRSKLPRLALTLALAAAALVLLWPSPHLESIRSPNELVRIYSVRAMVDDHSLSIDAQVSRHGPLSDYAKRKARLFSDKAPGLSLLGVPLYGLLRIFFGPDDLSNRQLLWLLRWALIALPTLLLLIFAYPWLLQLGLDPRLAAIGLLAYALGSPALAYIMRFEGHQAAAWMMGGAVIAAFGGNTRGHSSAAGALAGWAAITEYPSAPMLLLLGGCIAWHHRKDRWTQVGCFILGATLPLALGACYHQAAFGAPWRTGYSFIHNPAFRQVHAAGLLGLRLPKPEVAWQLLFGLQRGLFPLAPWLLLSIGGLGAWRQPKYRPLVLLLCTHALLLLGIASGFSFWIGGWSVGPRHMVSALFSIAVLSILGWEQLLRWRPWLHPLFLGLGFSSGIACTTIALTFPGFPEELQHPLFELSFPLLRALQFSHSVGSALGLRSDIAMIPALLASALLLLWMAMNLPTARSEFRPGLMTLGTAAWFAVLIFGTQELARPSPKAPSLFRAAWLTQTMWEPKDVVREVDPRPAHWQRARGASLEGRLTPADARVLGAMQVLRAHPRQALEHFARGQEAVLFP